MYINILVQPTNNQKNNKLTNRKMKRKHKPCTQKKTYISLIHVLNHDQDHQDQQITHIRCALMVFNCLKCQAIPEQKSTGFLMQSSLKGKLVQSCFRFFSVIYCDWVPDRLAAAQQFHSCLPKSDSCSCVQEPNHKGMISMKSERQLPLGRRIEQEHISR